MRLKNFLLSGFAAMVMLLLLVGTIGLNSAQSLNENNDEILILSEIIFTYDSMLIELQNLISANNAEDFDYHKRNIENLRTSLDVFETQLQQSTNQNFLDIEQVLFKDLSKLSELTNNIILNQKQNILIQTELQELNFLGLPSSDYLITKQISTQAKKVILLEELTEIINLIKTNQNEILEQIKEKNLALRSRLQIILLSSLIIAIVLSVLISSYYSRIITKPLSDLTKSNQLIIQGKFKEAQQQQQRNLPTEIQQLLESRKAALSELVAKDQIKETNILLQKTTKQLEMKAKFDDQKRVATLSLLEDMGEQKEQLAQSEEKLRTTLESIGDAVISTDKVLNITFMNLIAEKLTGYQLKEVKGKPLSNVFNIINEKTSKPVDNPLIKAIKEQKIIGLANHTVLIAKDGNRVPIDDSAAPIVNLSNQTIGGVLVFHDVTEQKKRQAEIEQRNQELKELSDELKKLNVYPLLNPGPLLQMDSAGIVLSANPAAKQIFKDVINKSFFNILGLDASLILDVLKTSNIYVTELKFKQTTFQFTFKRDLDTNLIMVYGANITSRKISEDKLQLAYQELKVLDKLKTDFLAMSSHELKTPLTPIKISAQNLLSEAIGSLNQNQKQSIEMILRNANSLNILLSDLLDSAKLEANRLKMYYQLTNLEQLINDSIADIKDLANKGNIKLKTNIQNLEKVDLDPERFKQVLVNLLNNSIKFTPANGTITIQATQQTKNIHVSVSDTGKGIEKEMLEKIFDKFAQTSPSYKEKNKGTGLGLTISKGIIDQFGGKIYAESKGLNQGATFHIILPIRRPVSNSSKTIESIEDKPTDDKSTNSNQSSKKLKSKK